MAASESLRFDIIGNDRGSDAFSRFGRSVSDVSAKMDGATARSIFLDDALKRQAETAKRSTDATLALAASDKILDEVERRLADGALEAELALKREADAKKKSGDAALSAAAKNKTFADSLSKIADSAKKGGGPAWLGPALALAPAAGTLTGVAAGASVGLAGAAVAGGAALAAFGAVAKPVLADALKAEQAVNTAQQAYQATIAAGVPKAQAQLSLQTANSNAMLTYSAALKGGAKPATALAAYHLTLAKNQLAYNAATNAGAFQAKAYAAEQLAIGKAYANLSPQQIALSKQLGNMANAWDNLKAAETPVVAGALQPWLQSVTSLTGKLPPVIGAVSPVIGDLGTMMNNVVTSPAFTTFRNFIANQGSYAVLSGGSALIDFFDAFIILLPKFTPLITMASNGIGELGQKVLNWSQSAKASQDIAKFMDWFRVNGPVVGGLLKNIGLALGALAPGLTAGGITELKLLSDFFGLVAKLPPAIAKPLLEVAGVLLTLNKLGVFSVGVKFVGKVASWLTNGVVSIGSGASAAAEMQAAMTAGGASAAAEIRAAMATGGTAAAAEVGAGEAAGGASAGGAVVAAEKAAAPAIGSMIGLAVAAQVGGYLAEKQFSTLFNTGVAGASSAGGAGLRQGAPLSSVLAGTGTNTSLKISVNTTALDKLLTELGFTQLSIGQINKLVAKPGANVGAIDALIYQLGGTQSDILAVNKLIVKPHSDTSNVDALLKRIGLTPPQIAGVNQLIAKPHSDTSHIDAVLAKLGLTAQQIKTINGMVATPRVNVVGSGSGQITATENILGMKTQKLGSLTFVARGGMITGGIPGRDSKLAMLMPGEVVVPTAMVQAGAVDHLRGRLPGFAAGGLVPAGMAAAPGWAAGRETAFIRGAANAGSGPLMSAFLAAAGTAAAAAAPKSSYAPGSPAYGGSILREQQFAASLFGGYGWSVPYEMPALISLWNQESGWNPYAANPTSNARGIPQNINGWSAYAPGDWANQIRWGESYIKGRYGSPTGAWAHEGAFNWYDNGGFLPPGLSLAYNGTGVPEPVIPASRIAAGAPQTIIIQVDPAVAAVTPSRDLGRHIAGHLATFIKGGGRIYPAGTAPR
jgi:hypothetical protein